MARSTIKYLNKQGYSNAEISKIVQHDPRTVARALKEATEKPPTSHNRLSAVAVFEAQIEKWFDQKLQVKRMLELAQTDPEHPYQGKPTAFYDYVRKVRETRRAAARQIAVRFEGLPGEFLQIDWGESRQIFFTSTGAEPHTYYFFCARLKYSRFMYVSFQKNMVEETLVRCLIESFLLIEGVPWVVTTDNMRTVVLRRDENHQPVWHPIWQKLAAEFDFHPEACAPASGNQKGAVENLVKYTENNFLAGRSFYDEADLTAQLQNWLHEVNYVRACQATEQIPVKLLAEEKAKFGPLPQNAVDYGLFESLVVNREGVVLYQTNRYSVPAQLVGQAVTVRVHRQQLRIFEGDKLVAEHPRCFERNRRLVIPEHFEKAFEIKPRARTMVYRDWLIGLSPQVYAYVTEISRKQRARLSQQIQQLYGLARQVGVNEFVTAVELAQEQGVYGAEYVCGITGRSPQPITTSKAKAARLPAQAEVERPLAYYEAYVSNQLEIALEGGLQ